MLINFNLYLILHVCGTCSCSTYVHVCIHVLRMVKGYLPCPLTLLYCQNPWSLTEHGALLATSKPQPFSCLFSQQQCLDFHMGSGEPTQGIILGHQMFSLHEPSHFDLKVPLTDISSLWYSSNT